MENTLRYNRRRSGYEPSDTETEWHDDSPKREIDGHDQCRGKGPLTSLTRAQLAMLEMSASPARRRHSKSPYNLRRNSSPFIMSEQRNTNSDNISQKDCRFSQSERRTINPDSNAESNSPFSNSDGRRQFSPFKPIVDGSGSNFDASQGRDRSSYSRRAATAPRSRLREKSPQKNERENKDASHKHGPSVGEINEMVAKAKISKISNGHANGFDSIDSISPGNIFFSVEYNALTRNGAAGSGMSLPKPPGYVVRNSAGSHQGISQTTTNSSSVISRNSSVINESSSRTTASTTRFVANRRKNQSDTKWFSCIKKGSCKTSNKSPEKEMPFDEASFIGKAVVVESLRPFWADKHQPVSLIGFICHKNEAQILQKLASSEMFPHILLKGPSGSGKKALTMALLREIYGDPVWNISHDLRYFHILESKPRQVVVPVSSSPHHVELNVFLESKAPYALTALVKQISSEYAVAPDFSVAPSKSDYKVLVLHDVDRAAENIQHLIKWILDCYSDSCKLILCCEDDADILDSVKSRCKIIGVEAPPAHENGGPYPDSQKEGFELSASFAAKIANKSKQNLRRAIMALEACKLHNYPFAEDQPIPVGWEEAVAQLAADILADPFPKRLFMIRVKIQKLLGDFVHPKLILLKLVERFLRGVDARLKREIFYWYAYYDKRLPSGTSALLKFEEFVAKFMSIYRKSTSNR